jgi:hypothetical protein
VGQPLTAYTLPVADTTGNASVDGTLTASGLTVAGSAAVGGPLTAASASVTGASTANSYTAPTVTATGALVNQGGVTKLQNAAVSEVRVTDTLGTTAKGVDLYTSLLRVLSGLSGAGTDLLDVDADSARFAVPVIANAGVQGQPAMSVATANFTLAATDQLKVVDATAGGIVVTVPAASAGKSIWSILRKDTSANVVTIAQTGADTLLGATTVAPGSWADIATDGASTVYVMSPGGAATSVAAANVTPGSFADAAYTFPNTVNITGGSGLLLGSNANLVANRGAGLYGPVTYLPTNRGNVSGTTALASVGGPIQMVTLVGNWSPGALGVSGSSDLDLYIVQDATGGHTVTWPAGTKVASDVNIATAANAWTHVRIIGFGSPPIVVVSQIGTGT